MLHIGHHNPQELSLQHFLQQYILETNMQLNLLKMKQSQIQLCLFYISPEQASWTGKKGDMHTEIQKEI